MPSTTSRRCAQSTAMWFVFACGFVQAMESNPIANVSVPFAMTVLSSARAIGVFAGMAAVGVYLTRSGKLSDSSRKDLAKISMTITIPALLFTSLIDCAQDSSSDACPSATTYVAQGWPLLLLPFVNVALGMLLGQLICIIMQPPENFRRAVIAAVAFGNSTGLPITLIQVISSSFAPDSELGKVNPTRFLSVYLILYPVLQWGAGGYLMGSLGTSPPQPKAPAGADESCAHSHGPPDPGQAYREFPAAALEEGRAELKAEQPGEQLSVQLIPPAPTAPSEAPIWRIAMSAALQPPVIAALAGIAVALTSGTAFDLRSIMVDTKDRNDDRPLEFVYDSIYKMGLAAVPINMIILGAGLGAFNIAKLRQAPWGINLCVVFAKMVIMPGVGVLQTVLLRKVVNIDPDMDASFYLVVMLVTVTPTANNVASMAELGGQDKAALSTCIFTQYLFAPILLGAWISLISHLASTY